jgi:hypothetical protein
MGRSGGDQASAVVRPRPKGSASVVASSSAGPSRSKSSADPGRSRGATSAAARTEEAPPRAAAAGVVLRGGRRRRSRRAVGRGAIMITTEGRWPEDERPLVRSAVSRAAQPSASCRRLAADRGEEGRRGPTQTNVTVRHVSATSLLVNNDKGKTHRTASQGQRRRKERRRRHDNYDDGCDGRGIKDLLSRSLCSAASLLLDTARRSAPIGRHRANEAVPRLVHRAPSALSLSLCSCFGNTDPMNASGGPTVSERRSSGSRAAGCRIDDRPSTAAVAVAPFWAAALLFPARNTAPLGLKQIKSAACLGADSEGRDWALTGRDGIGSPISAVFLMGAINDVLVPLNIAGSRANESLTLSP